MEKNYKDDIKLITFCRKATSVNIENDNNASVDAMSTDYFDIIMKQDYDADRDFIDITKSRYDQFDNSDIIAMHSYPIYCSKEELKSYDGRKHYSDPFDEESDMPFISIIQVHITPEVMARVIKRYTSDEYMDLFSSDLHKIIEAFAKNKSQHRFLYRVYRSLSVGDFVVIIRSEKEDTSFRISTLLRRRTAVNDSNDKNAVKLVMYKTYTVLSIYHTVIETEKPDNVSGRRSRDKNRFAVRCCFSNKYWRDKLKIEEKFTAIKEKIDRRIFRLNGRYDISVSLTRNEFMELSPLIAKYKGLKCNTENIEDRVRNWDPTQDDFDIIKYLGYMLCHGYFSYVNERYLISFYEPDCSYLDAVDNDIMVHTMLGEDYLDKKNREIHDILNDQFLYVEGIIKGIKGYRKNLLYYMSLIGRLIQLCSAINGLSDTRIYCYILMNQLGIVLNGIESYAKILDRDGDYNIRSVMDNIEEYLRRSVHALDSYACYIRNNNLQALQTPNYNLEGSFSIEKYLICYSEFLKEIIEQYNELAERKNIGGLKQKLVPVFEPDSLHDAISINVLFRRRDEMEEENNSKRIMLVRCSTFRELVNIPEITTALFHETAHQFRYEERKQRNEVLLKYSISSCFDIIVSELMENAKMDLPWLTTDQNTIRAIHDALVSAYLSVVCCSDTDPDYSYRNESLYSFKRHFMDQLNTVYDKTIFINNVRQLFASTTEKAKFRVNISDPQARDCVIKLSSLENDITAISKEPEENRLDKFKLIIDEAIKAAEYLNENNKLFNNMITGLKKYSDNGRKITGLFASKDTMEDIWRKAYDRLTEKSNSNPDADSQKPECSIARYLGLDYYHEASREEFVKQMNNIAFMARKDIFDKIEENIAQYREITADMFMCRLLSLSEFGYLNFIMRDTPVNIDISNEYITRFIYVIYSVFHQDDNIGFLEELHHYIDDGVKALNEAYESRTGKNLWNLNFEDAVNSNEERMEKFKKLSDECNRVAGLLYDKATELYDKATELYDKAAEESCSYAAEYAHYDKMYLLLSHLYISWEPIVKELNQNEALKQDLVNGSKMLEQMNDRFPDDNIKTYCYKFSEFWNCPRIRYGNDSAKLEQLNRSVIQFIQHMYYKNKFRNAEECYKWRNDDVQ